jgi:hypothetical protein
LPFVTQPVERPLLNPGRVALGLVAGSAVPSLVVGPGGLGDESYWLLFLFGCLSILTVYLPLMIWRLPRTRRPFLTCALLGALAAPGPIVIALAIISALGQAGEMTGLVGFVYLFTAPLGLVGGCVFWLCVVWRNPEFARGEA